MTRGNSANRVFIAAHEGKDGGGELKHASNAQVPRRQIRSVDLLRGQRELLIEHAGELYSLRQTSKGKLILTK